MQHNYKNVCDSKSLEEILEGLICVSVASTYAIPAEMWRVLPLVVPAYITGTGWRRKWQTTINEKRIYTLLGSRKSAIRK